MLWITLLTLFPQAGARPVDDALGKLCRVGNASLPVDVFEAYAGWECYEETHGDDKRLTVRVCVQRSGKVDYDVPCFKAGWRLMGFNLKNEESVEEIFRIYGSNERNDEMIRCYLNLVATCELPPDGWFGRHNGSRFFLPNMTANEFCLDSQSKFHVAMLSISMIIGIPTALLIFFCSWVTRNRAVFHCSNLITALVLRTFFTLLIETEVVSKIPESQETPLVNWAGCEALASFETIMLNLVLATLLILAIYILEYSKTNFEIEPNIRKAIYLILGFALALPVVWMIVMAAGSYGNCWMERTPLQWINDSLRIGYILMHFTVMAVILQRIMTGPGCGKNGDALFRKIFWFTLLLSPLFLLQFSLNASHPQQPIDSDAQVYTEYFFDGLQCAIVSLVYVLLPEVRKFILDSLGLERRRKCHRVFQTFPIPERERKIPDQSQRLKAKSSPGTGDESNRDVIYTSVLSPERFEKTIKMYNRFNAIPKHEQSTIEEEVPGCNSSVKSEYYDVDSTSTTYDDVPRFPVLEPGETATRPINKYYNSKYLVHDTDSSCSDESSKPADGGPKKMLVSSSESSLELPRQELDAAKSVETWLRDCKCEFEDYAKKALKTETTPKKVHRSLSGNILKERVIPGMVEVSLADAGKPARSRKKSAPSVVIFQKRSPEVFPPIKKELPSIYDDLKNQPRAPKQRADENARKNDLRSDWSNYRKRLLLDRKRMKSLEGLEIQRNEEKLSDQLNALLSPRYVPDDRIPSLKDNAFSRFNTENLNESGNGERVSDKVKLEDDAEIVGESKVREID